VITYSDGVLFFWYCHFHGIALHHVSGAAFHSTVTRHASVTFRAHSLFHAPRAATTIRHSGAAVFHHHFMLTTWPTHATVVRHPADTAGNKTDEKHKPDDNKEPGDKGKEFTGLVFLEFCQQKRTGKNRY